ncbi:ATP-binding cassette domain-containing protein [bacterium]|nr:ATP-binding cassette domain-containing protein [bacterium]
MGRHMILAESLGKRYILQHNPDKASYRTLRESLVSGASRLLRRPTDEQLRGEFWALRDVAFRIDEGEAVGIIGHNGAGKSTLLKILSRITEPTTGSVRLRGRVASLLEVGTGFHPELTGRENVYLNGSILGMTRQEIRARFDQIVQFAEVERFLDTPVKKYSSGMFVRLAFSVAAHLEPEVLIVDEVLSVGDAAFQQKCLERMKEVVRGEGRTVLFVSHNMAAIRLLCPRVITLDKGGVVGDGEATAVIEQYMDRVLRRAAESPECYSTANRVGFRNAQSALIPADGGLSLQLSLDIFGEQQGPIGIGIEITTQDGTRVSTQGSLMTHFNASVGERAIFTAPRIDELLSPGRYLVTVWFVKDKMLLRETGMLSFELPYRDLYGTGSELNVRHHGPVPIRWNATREAIHA